MVGGVKEELKGGGGVIPRNSDVRYDSRTQRDGVGGDRGDKGEDACGGFQLGEGGGSNPDGVRGGAYYGG